MLDGQILAELGECSDIEMENFAPSDRASSPGRQDNNSEVGTSAGLGTGLGTGSWDEPHDESASEEGDHDAGNQRTEPVAKKTSNVRMPLTIKIRPLPSKDTPLAVVSGPIMLVAADECAADEVSRRAHRAAQGLAS